MNDPHDMREWRNVLPSADPAQGGLFARELRLAVGYPAAPKGDTPPLKGIAVTPAPPRLAGGPIESRVYVVGEAHHGTVVPLGAREILAKGTCGDVDVKITIAESGFDPKTWAAKAHEVLEQQTRVTRRILGVDVGPLPPPEPPLAEQLAAIFDRYLQAIHTGGTPEPDARAAALEAIGELVDERTYDPED